MFSPRVDPSGTLAKKKTSPAWAKVSLAKLRLPEGRGVGLIRLVSSRGATVASTSPFVAARLQEFPEGTEREVFET